MDSSKLLRKVYGWNLPKQQNLEMYAAAFFFLKKIR